MNFSEWVHTALLAVIQGLTEFLPISSSAHLILPSQLLGWPDQGLAFDVGVHVGTLIAVMFYFRHELSRMTAAWCRSLSGHADADGLLAWLVILATLPSLVAGFMFGWLVDHYGRSILVIAATTLIFGVLLGWADMKRTERRTSEGLGLREAGFIGLAQALALIPGTSRSGITITAALMLGFDRQTAARFSFLLSIPVILGAGSLKGIELYQEGNGTHWLQVGVGTLIAGFSALACIHLFLKWLDRVGMKPFVVYRLLLGVLLLLVYFANPGDLL
ncbi:undecaprenyl-diphosphate phosphatase [Marinobacterium sediminicola]|uniref:Undecaprenyl-diphosphatase n=1 Tax=Marinobacterium sediminicola TaxID=518898 RepID=A0ABY1S030_9GAMM|nr:undecaprenyl-diphosphate phosphatase [Marinobacterium sediminicola]ULG69977.1 undecaprenyl-diphosphate phosphatase [Marinobacterium sediminicola]SMR74428.1 undecaprenyl-diphosphatase [Marinobacterium sediminicola]